MDVRLVLAVQGLSGISAAECGVLVALASCRDHRTGICNPSLQTVAMMAHISDRCALKCISSLKRKRFLKVSKMPCRHGERNSYAFNVNDALLRLDGDEETDGENGALGERGSPVHEIHPTPERGSPTPPNVVHPTPERGSPAYYTLSLKKDKFKDSVCVKEGHTHTNDDLIMNVIHQLGEEVPGEYVRWRFDELGRTGWTLANGAKVTPEAFAAHCLAWWRNERNPEAFIIPKRKEIAIPPEGWILCAERCANAKPGGGCKRGCRIPPDKHKDTPRPPEDCKCFVPLPIAQCAPICYDCAGVEEDTIPEWARDRRTKTNTRKS